MEIEVNTETLLWCVNEESKAGKNLNQIGASIQNCRKSIQKNLSTSTSGQIDRAIENACQRLNKVKVDNDRLADALRNIAGIYTATENDIAVSKPTGDQIVAVKNLSKKDSSAANSKSSTTKGSKIASVVSGAAADVKTSVKTARDAKKKVEDWIDKNVPKSVQKAAKKLYKETIGKKVDKSLEEAYKIGSKIVDGEYADAFWEFVDVVGGDNIKMLTTSSGGGLTVNWGGVKAQAVIKALQLAADFDKYAQKNLSKYEDLSNVYMKQLDFGGVLGSMLGGFVQSVGKGTVDVTCQLVSSALDSAVSNATGGKFTLSSLNDKMYDLVGTSPGHMFNTVSKGISDGVDFVVDEGLVKGMSTLGKAVGKGISTSIKAIGSLFH